ncbi:MULTISPECIES: peptidoglycan-binding domain-containing protein [unclassified Nostoc]|uniref:peptidoglycan-binding domain-containing protein n=1 Tax=unclassified Nostoc TaxID=2593658 RepID=UPI002AD21E28|nr:peptidoglycan-binding domain-containing protein [Nostoc sp. DedQUE03]MDZ7974203.1 peptidoglycan-binding domain-containing protein [Nostoc sp. DedQUE03]MDZ8042858.1 peptidoglycan-binding domain-containing protein [Nostoc sp. DedQUE02]
MQSSLTASILSYLKLLDPTVNRCRMEKRQKDWWPKRSKSLSAIKILLFSATPLLITSTAVVSIAAPQKIAQGNPQDSINRPSLKVGSQGERVSELQAALKLLGFYSGAVDGIYSENTASAVSRFKQAAGLNPDGIVDASTWQRLFPNQPVAASTVPSSQPRFNSATNFPVPTQSNNVTNVVNSNPNPPRQAVTQVATSSQPKPTTPKKAVTQVATSPEPRPATPRKTTTSSRQKTPNRTTSTTRTQATTRTGQNTRTQPKTSTQRTPGIQYTSEGMPILRIGLRGSEVVKLQQQLKKLGFLKGNADGDFGETTEEAVKAAQKRYGLEADGVVGGSTWEVLLRR